MYILSTIVCLAHGLNFECTKDAALYQTLNECLEVGNAYVRYIAESAPTYISAYCVSGGIL